MQCWKERKNMVVEKNIRVKINFYKKLYLPVITWKKKYLWKQVAPIKYALDKMLFAVTTFEGW